MPWTTSRIKGTPEPPAPYRTEPAFPGLKFEEPLAMAFAPGSDRVFVAQRYGKVYSFPNDPGADRAELVFDLKKQILGLTFHPRFEENGTSSWRTSSSPPRTRRPPKAGRARCGSPGSAWIAATRRAATRRPSAW